MIYVRCPVCNQTGEYPDKYANKWHRCNAGCRAIQTRLILVPGGTGILEGEVDAGWRRAALLGRLLRFGVAAAALGVATLPWTAHRLGIHASPTLLGIVAGAALVVAGLAARAGWTYWCPRPPGL